MGPRSRFCCPSSNYQAIVLFRMIPLSTPRAHKAFVLRRRNATPSFEIFSLHFVAAFSDAATFVDCPTQLISVFVILYFVSSTNAKYTARKSGPPTQLPLSEIPPCPP